MANGRDFRKLDMATQAELRRVAVAMVAAGKTRLETAAAVGVNRRYVVNRRGIRTPLPG
jgi:DNA-binding CsgD family transcriptional regulator